MPRAVFSSVLTIALDRRGCGRPAAGLIAGAEAALEPTDAHGARAFTATLLTRQPEIDRDKLRSGL